MYDRPKSISIIVASKGYDKSEIEMTAYGEISTRAGANLKYTQNDANGILELWKKEDDFEILYLINPTKQELIDIFRKADQILSEFDQDQTGIDFFFAGHGEYPTGALVLSDGILTASELVIVMSENLHPKKGDRGLGIILDSCYSGSFLVDLVVNLDNKYQNIFLFDAIVSAMYDEPAYEMSFLEQGVLTYTILNEGNGYVDKKLFKEAIENNNYKIIAKYMQGLVAMTTSPIVYLTQGKQHEVRCYKGNLFEVGNGDSFVIYETCKEGELNREALYFELNKARNINKIK